MSYTAPTKTGQPCDGVCPGMHDSSHNHPPPVLQFVFNGGDLCPSCTFGGYLMWDTGSPFNIRGCFGTCPTCDVATAPGGACAPVTLTRTDCNGNTVNCGTITYTCTDTGTPPHNSFTCIPTPVFPPYNCVDLRCNCACQYFLAVNEDGTIATSPTYDGTTILGVNHAITFGNGQGTLQDHLTRWKCSKYSRTVEDFVAQIDRTAFSTLIPSNTACLTCVCACHSCNPTDCVVASPDYCTNKPALNDCTPQGSIAACDTLYGRANWLDCRPICLAGPASCNMSYPPSGTGETCWTGGDFFSLPWAFQVDCLANPDSVIGCNPCPYCNPEADDCLETGDTGSEGFLKQNQKDPCNPCAQNRFSNFGVYKVPNSPNCVGVTNCATEPSCPDCASFPDCNRAFDITLYGPCGSYLHIFAP